MMVIQRFRVTLVALTVVLVSGCATWTGPQKAAFDACMNAWLAHENGPIGPKAEVYPKGYEKLDYCMDVARQTPSPALMATANDAGRTASRL